MEAEPVGIGCMATYFPCCMQLACVVLQLMVDSAVDLMDLAFDRLVDFAID